MQLPLQYTDEVRTAIQERHPLVALESTVISHGLPYPANREVAQGMERVIRDEGAVPATIALLNGSIHVGLTATELEHLATTAGIQKVSRRDMGITLAHKRTGATTVAGTMLCAQLAGIRFFATGGIGGVHRGAATSMDISADLTELSRTPVLVTCAGAKSILDLDLTLEYLETAGVPVIGWRTDELPAFYVRNSGRRLPHRLDEERDVASSARYHWSCGLGGIVVACPIAEEYALEAEPLERATEEALRMAQEQGIKGAETTPFVLAQVARITAGESVAANQALLLNNARWAARFAVAHQQISQEEGSKDL